MARLNSGSYECDGCRKMFYDHYCPPDIEAFGSTICSDCNASLPKVQGLVVESAHPVAQTSFYKFRKESVSV